MAAKADSGIYAIVNTVNGKRYIGSAVDIPTRWREHKRSLRRGRHHSVALLRAWNKYGEINFSFTVIENCLRDNLIKREQAAFDHFLPEYNTAKIAGSVLGITVSKEVRARISATLRGREFSDETRSRISAALKIRGPHAPEVYAKIAAKNRGRKASAETRAKQSASRAGKKPSLGVKHSDATRAAISKRMTENNHFRGKFHKAETKEKISSARKALFETDPSARIRLKEALARPDVRAKKSARMTGNTIFLGKKHSQETKDKLRAMFTGRTFSEETRQKMSAAQRRKAPPSAETRAKMGVSRSGLRNGSAIKVACTIEHVDGRRLTDIPMELRRQSGLSPAGLCQLMSGHQKSAKGWRLVNSDQH